MGRRFEWAARLAEYISNHTGACLTIALATGGLVGSVVTTALAHEARHTKFETSVNDLVKRIDRLLEQYEKDHPFQH